MNLLWSIVAVFGPVWAAYVVTNAGLKRLPDGIARTVLRLCLAVGFGFGFSACTYFLWRVLVDGSLEAFVAIDSLSWIAIGLVAGWWGRRTPGESRTVAQPGASNTWLDRRVDLVFAIGLAVAAPTAIGEMLIRPHGEWDAWAIWNLRARHLFRLADDWRQAFDFAFDHGDYPLLVPATVARWWTYLGTEALWASAAVGIAFTAATTAMVVAGVGLLRGRNHGLLAGLVLLGTPQFLRLGAMQYSDMPLAFYFLAALLLLLLYDDQCRRGAEQPCESSGSPIGLVVLAGLAMGLAAWTKNEGLLFCGVLVTVRVALVFFQHGLRRSIGECLALVVGAAPALAVVGLFKLQVPAQNDLVKGLELSAALLKAFDPNRIGMIARAFASNGVQLLSVYVCIIPLCFLLLGRYRDARGRSGDLILPVSVPGLLLAAYFGVYLLTPHDLSWHLATSLDRLLMQIWPMVVVAVFMQLETPDAVLRRAQVATGVRPAFGGNLPQPFSKLGQQNWDCSRKTPRV